MSAPPSAGRTAPPAQPAPRPRRPFPVPIEFGVYGDVDMSLEIRVDRQQLARRCILVRRFSL